MPQCRNSMSELLTPSLRAVPGGHPESKDGDEALQNHSPRGWLTFMQGVLASAQHRRQLQSQSSLQGAERDVNSPSQRTKNTPNGRSFYWLSFFSFFLPTKGHVTLIKMISLQPARQEQARHPSNLHHPKGSLVTLVKHNAGSRVTVPPASWDLHGQGHHRSTEL